MTDAYLTAMNASLAASLNAFDESPLPRFSVANAVGMEAAERARELAARAENAAEAAAPEHRTPSLLGCWINGKLRFQSRNHDAIHDYAEKHMAGARNFGNDVWVAPVGSFITPEQVDKANKGKIQKVKKAA